MPTVVLVHGAWLDSSSWDAWCERYEARGYECLAPEWPQGPRVGVTEIVDHYEQVIRAMPEEPVLIGHSFGGLFVQMLLDRGVGAAGIAIDSAPPKGVMPSGSAIRASLPAATAWRGGRRLLEITEDQFVWGFVHQLPEAEQHAAYEKYTAPTPGRIFKQVAAAPFAGATRVDFRDDARAPLLLVSGSEDRTVTAGMNEKNYRKYRGSAAVTELKEYEGRSHWTILEPGWEQLADDVIAWAEANRAPAGG